MNGGIACGILPVVEGGTIVGIVSMNDLLLAAGDRKALRNDEIVDTFQAICEHEHLLPRVA